MADLKMTLTDSEEEQEKLKSNPHKLAKKNKREEKLKKKQVDEEENDPIAIDSNFTLIDDSIRKDVSKIARKREYDASKQEGTSWRYQNAVKNDVNLNKIDDCTQSLKNKIIELRREVDLNEFDKGLEEIYKKFDRNLNSINDTNDQDAEKFKIPANKIGAHAKIHYEKDDLISFNDLFLSRPLVKACNSLEYDHPTRIQSQVIPNIIENRDLLVNAVTGSGKTASYLLPILEKLHRRDLRTSKVSDGKISKTRVLIFHPTRELAAQCSSMLEYLNKFIFPKITVIPFAILPKNCTFCIFR